MIYNKIGGGKSRIAGLDIVRCVAILFVIAGHFFLNTQAHDTVFTGVWIFPQGIFRTLFQANVPLFLILTGYLNLNKKLTRQYYRGMIAVVLSYLFISAVTILFRIWFLEEHLSVIQWILKVTDFSAIAYGWYIEMWIGLFLLTPFLNILWKNIETVRHKQILILTLYVLCGFPDLFNRYGVHLVPGYWTVIYPCAFYFIGAYIREFQPKVHSWLLLVLSLGICMINPLFNFIFVDNRSMIQLIGGGNGVFGIPLATMIFLLLYRLDINNNWFRGLLESISKVSLDMYLASFMFDVAMYSIFKPYISADPERSIIWFFLVVPIVFIESYLFSVVKGWLFRLIHLPTK